MPQALRAAAGSGPPAVSASPPCSVRPTSGAEYFLDLLGFDHHVADADLVITGEGRLDHQTLQGKLPAAVALRAERTPVVAVVGRNDLNYDSSRHSSPTFSPSPI